MKTYIACKMGTRTIIIPEREPTDGEWCKVTDNSRPKWVKYCQYTKPADIKESMVISETVWQESELLRTDSMLQSDRPNAQDILNYRKNLRAYNNHIDFPDGVRPKL